MSRRSKVVGWEGGQGVGGVLCVTRDRRWGRRVLRLCGGRERGRGRDSWSQRHELSLVTVEDGREEAGWCWSRFTGTSPETGTSRDGLERVGVQERCRRPFFLYFLSTVAFVDVVYRKKEAKAKSEARPV